MAKYLFKYNKTNSISPLVLFYGLKETEYALSYVFNPENLMPVRQLNRNARVVCSLGRVYHLEILFLPMLKSL